jgi:hypothetical protein
MTAASNDIEPQSADHVAAHVALNALTIAAGNVATVREHWSRLDAPHRDRLLGAVVDRLAGVEAVLRNMARGHAGSSLAAAAELLVDLDGGGAAP